MAILTLYVIAGPNGIGKTTSAFSLIPSGVPIINSDEINRQVMVSGIVNVNMQEYSNREAMRLVNEHIENRQSFAIETNLADVETWKFLKKIKETGYKVHLLFLCTEKIELLNTRIAERTKRGEHFVRPDVVEQRYITGLKLLNHYFEVPDRIQLIDNSDETIIVAEKYGNTVQIGVPDVPEWVTHYLSHHISDKKKHPQEIKNLSADDVKKKYQEMLKGRNKKS